MRVFFVYGKGANLRHVEFPLWAVISACLLLTALLVLLVSWLGVENRWPAVNGLVEEARQQGQVTELSKNRKSLEMLAPMLADLHFQVLQLDTQGERLATLVGMRRGWREMAMPQSSEMLALTTFDVAAMRKEVDFITQQLELKTDAMSMIELFLIEQRLRTRAMQGYVLPVPPMSKIGSGYGLRADPFSGQRVMHKGIDFEVLEGTPILSVADGLVSRVAVLPDYGNLVEVIHRDGQTTRYAHLRQSSVRQGQLVRGGEAIGLSGNSGRSTGPHLHFEVLELGIHQNPLSLFIRRDPLVVAR